MTSSLSAVGVGGTVHQGNLLNAVKNIFPDFGMENK